MIRIVFLHFPLASAEAVAAHIAKTPPVPDFMALQGPLVKHNGEQGISTMSLYRFDDSRLEEAMAYLQTRYALYSTIADVDIVVEEWIDADHAVQLLDESDSIDRVIEMFSLDF